jgi:diguanylate cyclase (GGDEF)-like protein
VSRRPPTKSGARKAAGPRAGAARKPEASTAPAELGGAEAAHAALYDRLTGLPNRTLLRELVERAMARAASGGERYAVLCLGCDRLGLINDSLGHDAGDRLLTAVADRLRDGLAAQAGADGSFTSAAVARPGGDEFVVLLSGIRGVGDAVRTAQRVQERLSEPLALPGGPEVYCTAGVGVAPGDPSYARPEEVLRDAGAALRHAKAAGRARHAIFETWMRERATTRLRMEVELRRALERGELVLHYQPIVELESGRTSGLEALVRWQHPERGMINPVDFVPAAEDTGLIVPLGAWALREACRQLSAWRRTVPGAGGVTMSVNLSRKQFIAPSLVEDVAAALRSAGLEPAALSLEVTESAVMEDPEASVGILQRLRAMGVGVSMDDFGTGYSSLGCLRRLPITALKMDRSFVEQTDFSMENPAIIEAIVTLARNLKMRVVAEGVETKDQLATFLALDCDMVQGYFFSRPLAPADVPGWLAQRGGGLRAAA